MNKLFQYLGGGVGLAFVFLGLALSAIVVGDLTSGSSQNSPFEAVLVLLLMGLVPIATGGYVSYFCSRSERTAAGVVLLFIGLIPILFGILIATIQFTAKNANPNPATRSLFGEMLGYLVFGLLPILTGAALIWLARRNDRNIAIRAFQQKIHDRDNRAADEQ